MILLSLIQYITILCSISILFINATIFIVKLTSYCQFCLIKKYIIWLRIKITSIYRGDWENHEKLLISERNQHE
jgi:hypothetical protein